MRRACSWWLTQTWSAALRAPSRNCLPPRTAPCNPQPSTRVGWNCLKQSTLHYILEPWVQNDLTTRAEPAGCSPPVRYTVLSRESCFLKLIFLVFTTTPQLQNYELNWELWWILFIFLTWEQCPKNKTSCFYFKFCTFSLEDALNILSSFLSDCACPTGCVEGRGLTHEMEEKQSAVFSTSPRAFLMRYYELGQTTGHVFRVLCSDGQTAGLGKLMRLTTYECVA